jgi:hypothetical protein
MGSISQLQQIGIAGAGSSALSSAASGFGKYESGQQQKAAYDYDAAVTLEKMRESQQTTQAKYSNLIGKQATAYAAAGIDISSGSALLMMAHTAARGGVESASEAEAGDEESNLQKYYGKVAAFQGTIGGISTFISELSKSALSIGGMMGPGGSPSPNMSSGVYSGYNAPD